MKTEEFKSIVEDHCALYPGMQLEDLYKLAHQSAMGSEHEISDESIARRWLSSELGKLPETSDEPLMDIISPDRTIARIHLVPFNNRGGEPEKLLQAFIRTGNEYTGSRENLRTFCLNIREMALQGALPIPVDSFQSFFDWVKAQCYPAIHHSKFYSQACQPHYRIVASNFLAFEEESISSG